MPKEAVFTMKLEPELREAFMAEAEAVDRPASQIVRELMRDFVQKRQQERSYQDFLQRSVDIARAQIASGKGFSQEEVEAEVAARRAALFRRIDEAEA
jgi:predicted transcriptional regulator